MIFTDIEKSQTLYKIQELIFKLCLVESVKINLWDYIKIKKNQPKQKKIIFVLPIDICGNKH